MSLASLRDGTLSAKSSDRAASLRKRSSKLRALNAITATITQHCGLSPSLNTDFDAIPAPPLTPSESRFLDENDLEKGRYFRNDSLPVTLKALESISPFKLRPKSAGDEASGVAKASTENAAPASHPTANGIRDVVDSKPPLDLAKEAPLDQVPTDFYPKRADSGPIKPSDVARKNPDHHAKTVHLPPREVQEERLRARRQSRDELRAAQLREAEHVPVDVASSPSSTVGGWSAATPAPADHSPMTSVGDEATAVADRQDKKSDDSQAMAIDETSEKREHDKALDAQKEAARREILGPDLASPGVQLRLEQEQAAKASQVAQAAGAAASAATSALESGPPSKSEAAVPEPHDSASGPPKSITDGPTKTLDAAKSQPPRPTTLKDSSSDLTQPPLPTPSTPASDKAIVSKTPTTAVQTTPLVPSGSLRQKPVSDVISKSPKSSPSGIRRGPGSEAVATIDPSRLSHNPQTLLRQERAKPEQRISEAQDQVRSTSESHRYDDLPLSCEGYEALRGAPEDPMRDYLEPLFRMQTHDNLPINKTLAELLTRANKVVSTSDQFAGIHERQDHRILRRIYALQNANKWSLRQMQPAEEPEAPKTHMDYLIAEMRWMRTDFRQERKYKKQLAKYFAEECAAWVNSDASGRFSRQIAVKASNEAKTTSNAPHSPAETNFENHDQGSQDATSLPELEPADERDASSPESDLPRTPNHIYVPKDIFPAMSMDKDNLHNLDTDQFLGAINELPLYTTFDDDPPHPDAIVQRPVPSVSKFCEAKLMIKIPDPIKKRSRYDYSEEDEDDALSQIPKVKRTRAKDGGGLDPEQTDVALFDPENKLLRDRLHSNTAFRPPSEFPMPASHFYEFRTSSQWIAEDDQLLRRLAKDYSFNWSLIADEMSLPSKLAGAADRRTPWECFERWVELESLPNEMRKTLYFKTWNQRIETAQRNNDLRYQAQLQQQSQNGAQPQNIQRRRTQPVRVEKRRTSRYLHVVDAMRKNARKREQHAHKQAEAQKAASLRKQHESTAPKGVMHSPAEFSRLRHERDVQYAQRQEQYRQQVLERQRQAALQQRSGQYAGQAGHPNANQQRPANGQQAQPGHPTQHVGQNGQMQPPAQGQAPRGSNAHLANAQMGMQGNIPQAQMQANMRGGSNNVTSHGPADSMQQQRLALEQAHRQAQLKQQAQMNGQQFQMGPPNRASPGGAHVPNGMMNGQANPAMMSAIQQQQQVTSHGSAPNGTSMQQNYNAHTNGTAVSASPHVPTPPNPSSQTPHPQQLSSGHVPAITQITHQLQAKHPNATPEQIKELTSQHLKQFYSQQQTHQARQNAMHAAAGTQGVAHTPSTPAAYNQNQAQSQTAFQQNTNATPNGHPNGTNNVHQTPNMQANGHQAYGNNPANGVSQNQYSSAMRQQLIQQRQNQLQTAAVQAANGSPRVAQASPNVTHASPSMSQAVPSNMSTGGAAQAQQLNRTPTPQMARLSSAGPNVTGNVNLTSNNNTTPTNQVNGQGNVVVPPNTNHQSPASGGMAQGSPRAVAAGVAQRQ
ncbi:hypothetical protein AAFC00_003630 [Neodothiora populina]|uniref:Vacuolar import and degradation protein 21 n=1 Tax=Neodothiora populina TaxID=2781224 RepID=A0ABR3PFY0_9PEZI